MTAPWTTPDHAARLTATLNEMPVGLTAYPRDSHGRQWAVTRISRGYWAVRLYGRSLAAPVQMIVEFMEAE
jgi:hypothetical protein